MKVWQNSINLHIKHSHQVLCIIIQLCIPDFRTAPLIKNSFSIILNGWKTQKWDNYCQPQLRSINHHSLIETCLVVFYFDTFISTFFFFFTFCYFSFGNEERTRAGILIWSFHPFDCYKWFWKIVLFFRGSKSHRFLQSIRKPIRVLLFYYISL